MRNVTIIVNGYLICFRKWDILSRLLFSVLGFCKRGFIRSKDMAEYIEKQSLIIFLDNLRQPKMPITEGFKFVSIDSIIEYLSKQPNADVVERSEYMELLKENERLRGDLEFKSEALNSIGQIHKEYVSKIDKAVEEMNGYARFHRDKIHNDVERGKYLAYEKSLEILKINIGE